MIDIKLNDSVGLEVKSTATDYKIDIMRNGLIIGTISGRNSSAGGGGGPVPANTGSPTISDTTPEVNQLLTGSVGTWSNSPTTFTYKWYRNGVFIPGATSITYTTTSADYNLAITFGVFGINSNGPSASEAVSSATSNVTPLPPVASGAPLISGITTTGNTLSATDGSITGQGTITLHRQWTKNGVAISGETGNTYLVDVTDEDNFIGYNVYGTNSAGASSIIYAIEVYISDPSLSNITSNHVYSGTDRAIVYTPPGYSNNVDNYPLVIFYHGNGERGVCVDSFTGMGTANGVTTNFGGNLNNTDRIIHSSVYVTVNGVQVATGRFGVISGTGVTGTYDYDDPSNSAVTLNITPAPASGAVRIYWTRSELLSQGPFKYLNLGDQPGLTSVFDNCIIACPQISRVSGGFDVTEWVNFLNYMVANFRINTNRIATTGLSLGADMNDRLMNSLGNDDATDTYEHCAYVSMSPGSNSDVSSGASGNYESAANKGKLYIRGTSEGAGIGDTKVTSLMANCNGRSNIEFPIQSAMNWGIGHGASGWDTFGFNRKDRNDATGTAKFDYLKFLLRFSLDPIEQATLFVRYAEDTENHIDYRLARRQVNNLSSSPTKTALTNDLDALKLTIGNAILIDFGTSGKTTTGNYNNVSSPAAGTMASPTNLKDDEGNSTGISLEVDTTPAASPATLGDLGSNRTNGRAFGFEYNTNVDGHLIDDVGTTGTYLFTGTNNSKTYTLRIYVSNAGTTWTTRAEIEATFGGATKYLYCQLNNFFYIEFTGLVSSGNLVSGTVKQRLTASTEKLAYIQVMEFIEE